MEISGDSSGVGIALRWGIVVFACIMSSHFHPARQAVGDDDHNLPYRKPGRRTVAPIELASPQKAPTTHGNDLGQIRFE
jgi:hypothetical protein